jgi:hypothetical protein
MPLVGYGKLVSAGKTNTRYLSIPAKLVLDSSFPFEISERVRIIIDIENDRLIVEKMYGEEDQ